MKAIKIERTEQWEYTAYGYDMEATGSSEQSAELNLLKKVIDKLEKENLGCVEANSLLMKIVKRNEGVIRCNSINYTLIQKSVLNSSLIML